MDGRRFWGGQMGQKQRRAWSSLLRLVPVGFLISGWIMQALRRRERAEGVGVQSYMIGKLNCGPAVFNLIGR